MQLRWPFVNLLSLLLGVTFYVNAADSSSIQERMSQTEFQAAGLGKLSQQELKNLNEWLQNHSLTANPVAEDRTGFRTQEANRAPISSRIEGNFTGWSGKTVFKLQNGQWWQQTEKDSYAIKAQDNPEIHIEPSVLGSWLLKVEGYNRSVRVTRIR